MTHAATHFCALGAIGWDHPQWVGPFYPEDLPEEWRLAYYNTQFDCVFLPYPLWAHAPLPTVASWAEETLERFRFLLEHPPRAPDQGDYERIAALGERAVLLTAETRDFLLWFDAGTDLKDLAARLQAKAKEAFAGNHRLYLLSFDADLASLLQVRTLLEVLGY